MTISAISPAELEELVENGKKIDLIDVCTPVEYRAAHIRFARSFPLETLDPASVMRSRDASADEPLYVICRSGNRGRKACEKFLKAGISNVVNVEGGMAACAEAGLPVVRGKKALSLERQVRITVGSFIVLGAALGWLVNQVFFGLSAFMGAGLIYAGITDTCAMAAVLGRMPWNRCSQTEDPGSPCLTSQAPTF